MTNFFNTLPYRITGDNLAVLVKYDVTSQKKIIQLGYAALLPTLMWFATAFITSYIILGKSFLISLFVAVFCSAIILIVERTIVMSKKVSSWGIFFRSFLGILFAFIGSSMLDLIIYQDDIDYKIKSELLAKGESDVQAKSALVNTKSTELHNEMFGKGGTRMKGYDRASKSIEKQLTDLKAQRDLASANFESAKSIISDPSHPQYRSMMNTLGTNTIVYRHEKLFEILSESNFEITFYLIVLLIGILLEIIPLIIKLTSSTSQYEKDLEAQEQLIENNRKRILEKSQYYTSMNSGQRAVYDNMKVYDKLNILN
jgi:hypothetical protein